MTYSLVYVTAGSRLEAANIAEKLIEKHLAACVNILGDITSFFMWEGKIQNEKEVSLIIKTKSFLVDDVIDTVKAMHSYNCPCIISIPIEKGNNDYLDWVGKETL